MAEFIELTAKRDGRKILVNVDNITHIFEIRNAGNPLPISTGISMIGMESALEVRENPSTIQLRINQHQE